MMNAVLVWQAYVLQCAQSTILPLSTVVKLFHTVSNMQHHGAATYLRRTVALQHGAACLT